MPVNVSQDAWYRPLYDIVHSGLLSLGYTHDYKPGPAKAVRAFDGASDVPLECYHQDLSNGLSLIVKLRGVLKFGSLLFSLSHALKHPTLTRILRDYSRAGEKYPGMSIDLGLLMSRNRRPDPVVSKALRSWIEKASSRDQLIEIGSFWIGEERDFILPYVSQIKEEEFLSAALSPRLHPAYSLAVLLYLGKFE
ncbi:MAG: hypothetical protein HY986_00270 [Candidatus Melainabacteria bacterium]|nr:hypothetical protein [Candidatus Melainabacteria bacterium]